MKKLLTIFCLILSFASFGQNNNNVPVVVRTSGTTVPSDARLQAKFNFNMPVYSDTTQANLSLGNDSCGAQIFTYTNNYVWIRGCSPKRWLPIGTGSIKSDTLFAQLPAFFDSTTRSPNTILKILQGDGFTPGIVTWDSLLVFSVSPSSITLSNKTWNFPAITLTLSPADPTYSRYDLFGIDTSGPFVLKGTPSPSPTIPQVGVDSFALTSGFLINPGDTIPSTITSTIIYNEPPIGWELGTQGATSTVNFYNTDNPYRGTKDIFISKYQSGSQFFFIDSPFIRNTPTSNGLISFWIYLNGALPANNNLYLQFWSFDTLTGRNLLINSDFGFNRNDSNHYQQVVIPFSKVTWQNSGLFTSLIFTLTGNDTSRAKGLYIDYMTLQQGIPNIPTQTYQDSNTLVKTTVGSDTLNVINWWSKGIPHPLAPIYTHSGGSSGGGGISKLGSPAYGLTRTNDSTYIADTTVIMPRSDSTAGGYYPYSSNPKNYLTSIDTTNISNFSVKVRSLFGANAPITYNSATGKFGADTSTAITGLTTLYQNSLHFSTKDTTVTASSNGQTSFVFSSLPTRYLVMINGTPFTNFTTSGGTTIIVGMSDILIGDKVRLFQTQ